MKKTGKIFVGKIPTHTTVKDLKKFIESGISLPLRLKTGLLYKILDAEIIKNVDEATLEVEFHGVVTLKPDAIVDQIIERLDATNLKGRPVTVRRYYERNSLDDRRQDELALQASSNRLQDRRTQISVDFDEEKSKFLSSHAEDES